MSPRPHKFHFHIDEDFPVPAGKFLQSLGHNIEFGVAKASERGLTDHKRLSLAIKGHRILLTRDRDYTQEHLRPLVEKSYGVVQFQTSDPRSKHIILILNRMLKQLSTEKIKGKVFVADVHGLSNIR